MSDNGFLKNDRLKSVLSRIKSRVGSDIASAISESTSSLSSVITSGDLSSLNEAKGYADGLKVIIDSNITNGDSSTLSSAKSYTDGKISSVNLTINDLNESIPGQINLALENYTEYSDFSNHTSNTNNPHNVTYSQTGAAAASHTHTEADITDLGDYASSSHTHTLSNITDITATATELNTLDGITATTTELNNTANSTRNIQMQLNDARMYGFFPKWEYNHEYNVEDCVKIPCCTTTQYLECMVAGVSGLSPDYTSNQTIQYYALDGNINTRVTYDIYFSMDELESVSNGQCFVDGTCVWIVQDIRDTRPIGSITPLLWKPLTTYGAYENYGIGIINETTYYDGSSNKIYDLETPNYLCFIRLIKRIIGSAIFTVDNANDRFFNLTGNLSIDEASSKYLSHLGTALVVLDWCFNPFNYLRSDKINTIDSKAYNYINHILNNYNTTYGVNLTENQIKTTAITIKNKIKSNNVSDGIIYLKNNKLGNHPYLAMGNYGVYINAGLPNITGYLGNLVGGQANANTNSANNSAMYWSNISHSQKSVEAAVDSNKYGRFDPSFNASRSNSIYGNSTTVTPNSIAVYYYMKY